MKTIREIIALLIFLLGWTIVTISCWVGGKDFTNNFIKKLND